MPNELCRGWVWPLCLAAHTAPIVIAAALVPSLLTPVAAATTLAMLVVLLAIERVRPHRAGWSVAGDREIWRDVGHSLAYAVLAMNVARFAFLVVLAGAISSAGIADAFGIWPADLPVWLQILVVVVLGDALEYGYHRLCHRHPLLWRLHAIHHTPVRLNVLKGARHHVLYAFGRGIAVWLPLLVLGAPPELVYWQFIAETITGLAGHANVGFAIPAMLHRVLVTPQFHRLHHAADPRLGDSNFGVVFPWWDMLFGTHADPLRARMGEPGIEGDPIPRRFLEELKAPFSYPRLVAQAGREAAARAHDDRRPSARYSSGASRAFPGLRAHRAAAPAAVRARPRANGRPPL